MFSLVVLRALTPMYFAQFCRRMKPKKKRRARVRIRISCFSEIFDAIAFLHRHRRCQQSSIGKVERSIGTHYEICSLLPMTHMLNGPTNFHSHSFGWDFQRYRFRRRNN